MVNFPRGSGIVIKRNSKIFKGFLYDMVVLINKLLRRNPFLSRFHGYGYAMLVTAADK